MVEVEGQPIPGPSASRSLSVLLGAPPASARTAALSHIRQPVAETNRRQVGGKPAGDPPPTRDLKFASGQSYADGRESWLRF